MTDYQTRRTMMVDTQIRPSDVTKFPIIEAMLTVRREAFVPDDQREVAYVGKNLELGDGRVLLEPRTLAKMLDILAIEPDEMVLDVGCGLGYSTAVIARIAEAVVAVEENESWASEAEGLLAQEGADNAAVLSGPLTEGSAKHGPYDVVVIEGGVERLPDAIADQLKIGGRIVCLFMDGELGTCRLGLKQTTGLSWRDDFNATAPILPGFENETEFAL
jgi:protein-L-isoaspartate(D-aspartate) O-methyltransferase